MAISSFPIAVILASLTFFGYSQSKDTSLLPFGKKVKNDLSDDAYNSVFAANFKSPNEFKKAADAASDTFEKVLGVSIGASLRQKLNEEAKRLASDTTSSLIYNVYVKAIKNTLLDEGVLNEDNVDELAKKYAAELRVSAKSLSKTDNIQTTLPALSAANSRFFKSLGLPKDELGKKFGKNLIEELSKH